MVEKVLIMGAAGRDFHNFNVYFKNNPRYDVIAFTAAQIPKIEGRIYPPELSGPRYPDGIPIYPEERLSELIRKYQIDLVAFSYSDVSHEDVMHKASLVTANGADFTLVGATYTMIKSVKPVIAVCAVRTGCGKSQTTRKICDILKQMRKTIVVVRHPMPYGDLKSEIVQRFSTYEDFGKHRCTIEEREEYEPLVERGIVVYAGIDYQKILTAAENEADIIIWDGGNNDTPFFCPDIHIVLFDPLRPGHERRYFPGETNMVMADIAIINKVDSADTEQIETVRKNIETYAPAADIILAESSVTTDRPELIHRKTVLVVEDGPTLTHGEMAYGAGMIAALRFGANHVVDPRTYAVGSILDAYHRYPHIGQVLPAMGYDDHQLHELEQTINNADCDIVLLATPVNLSELLRIRKPALRVRYEYQDHGSPCLEDVLKRRLTEVKS